MPQPPPASELYICFVGADQGNEGVDVKEGSLNTVIENNAISMQRDENAGGKLPAHRCPARRAMLVIRT